MKKIIVAGLLLASVSAHAVDTNQEAAADKACSGLAENIKVIAEQRDRGVPKEDIVQLLKSQPFTPAVGLVLAGTNDVYKNTNMTPVQLEQRYHKQCVQRFSAS